MDKLSKANNATDKSKVADLALELMKTADTPKTDLSRSNHIVQYPILQKPVNQKIRAQTLSAFQETRRKIIYACHKEGLVPDDAVHGYIFIAVHEYIKTVLVKLSQIREQQIKSLFGNYLLTAKDVLFDPGMMSPLAMLRWSSKRKKGNENQKESMVKRRK